jgi:hypothetical protein
MAIEFAIVGLTAYLETNLNPYSRTVKFENGLMVGKEYKAGRYTFTTKEAMRSFNFIEPFSSGLLGPVTIQQTEIK